MKQGLENYKKVMENIPPHLRKKGSRRGILTPKERLAIVHSAIVEQKKYKDIAKEFRTTIPLISIYVSKAKKNQKFISELFAKEEIQEKKVEMVKEVVEEMRDNDVFIDSCKMVTKEVWKKFFHIEEQNKFGISEQ